MATRTDHFVSRYGRYALVALFTSLLAACAGAPPPPRAGGPSSPDVDSQVRQPAHEQSSGVQVYPLQNPAVKSLLAEAKEAEAAGDFNRAAVALERALRIQPRDPELLQQMAEVQLQKKDYEQALSFATRSYDSGSRVGEICSRNWHTISVARENTGDSSGATQAKQRAGQCMNAKPTSY